MEQIVNNIEHSKKDILVSVAKLPTKKFESNLIVSKIIMLRASQANNDFSKFYRSINGHYEQLQNLLFPHEQNLKLLVWEEQTHLIE